MSPRVMSLALALVSLAACDREKKRPPAAHPVAQSGSSPLSAAPSRRTPAPRPMPASPVARGAVRPSMSVVWSAEGTTQTFSSPRCADLSGDGVLDVVLGHGVTAVDPERRSAVGSVTAHDGKTGALLWRH